MTLYMKSKSSLYPLIGLTGFLWFAILVPILVYFIFPGKIIPLFRFLYDIPRMALWILIMMGILSMVAVPLLLIITYHLKRQVNLHRSIARKYSMIAEHTSDVIWTMDLEGRFTYVSPSVKKLRGYEPEEVLSQSLDETMTPDSLKTISGLMDRFRELINSNPPKKPSVKTDVEQIRKDGSTVWTEASVTTIFKDGKPDFVLGVSRDISERKRRERELLQSEENYRLLAETTQDYIIAFDMEGFITYVNKAALDTMGYPVNELAGMKISELLPDSEKERMAFYLNMRIGGYMDKFLYEMDFRNKNGKMIPMEVCSAPILLSKRPLAVLITARDISERKQAKQRLEEKVKLRTAEMKEANRELEAFSYSVSHDLRAPLRHIGTFSKLLISSLNDDKQKVLHYLKMITTSVERMNSLIDDLLLFSRVGKTELHKNSFGMEELVKQVINESAFEYSGRNIIWEVNPLGQVTGDKKLLKMVWSNLISNAVKFTRDSSPAIIKIGRKEHHTFYIEDNGVGFNPDSGNKLFGVFQRLHSESEFEGTGIGLANVKRIIDRHGGVVSAMSELKKGAKFSFTLPG